MKLRIWHIVVFAAALVVWVVALAPANLLYRGSEGVLTFQRAEGTIWRATLRDVDFGGLNGGDADVTVSLLGLLQGMLVSDVELSGPDLRGQLRLSAGLDGNSRIESPALTIAGLRVQGFGRVPGATRLAELDVSFRQQACAAADGKIDSDVLVKIAEQTGGGAPVLTGAATCVGRVARLTLQGDKAGDNASALLDLSGDGTGTWNVAYSTSNAQLAAVLLAAGFVPAEQGGVFTSKGVMTWLP